MTLRLTIDATAWQAHVDAFRNSVGSLIPVVKGNGYGIGRVCLARIAAQFAPAIAVGTTYELGGLDVDDTEILVLTPAARLADGTLPPNAVPAVSTPAHVAVLQANGWTGRVSIKLASSMHRFGVDADRLASLIDRVNAAGFGVHSMMLHTPLIHAAYNDSDATAEIEGWLETLTAPAFAASTHVPVSVSHLSPRLFADLVARHPQRKLSLRSGTALWHGDKSFLHLQADVVAAHRLEAGDRAGYRSIRAGAPITVVVVGAGSAHGVSELPDHRSPFHFARQRRALLEPPHMHSSMLACAPHDAPSLGDWLDVQRPLITVAPDEVVWR